METPRKFIVAELSIYKSTIYLLIIIINLRGVSTKLNKYIAFTMQTYKKLTNSVQTIQQRGGQSNIKGQIAAS